MKKQLKVIELFAGIGAPRKALIRGGYNFKIVDAIEIDKYAVKSYNAIYNANIETKDVCKYKPDKTDIGEIDLLFHGSPCQDFSLAGKQAGGDKDSGTRSSLMYETIRIVEELKPKYVIWENVKNLLSKRHRHNFDAYLEKMEQLGYTNYYQVLNAKDYGIPQNRERVFTVSILGDKNYEFPKGNECDNSIKFEFPPKQELKLKLKDILEDNVDEKYYLSDKQIKCLSSDKVYKNGYIRGNQFKKNINPDVCTTITASSSDRASDTFISIKNATKKVYLEATDNGGKDRGVCVGTYQYAKSDKFMNGKDRLQLGKEVSDTLQITPKEGVVINPLKGISGKSWQFEQQVYDENGCARTLKASEGSGNISKIVNDLRIRKLTPKECWRLMGFDDSDYEKASKVNSNTQLYKQAGNSIVVNVLEAIFDNLLQEYK